MDPRDGEPRWNGEVVSVASSGAVCQWWWALQERENDNRVKGYGRGSRGKRTGDGRVRSESWQAFWIGIERLSEMEMESMYTLHMGETGVMRAPRGRERREEERRLGTDGTGMRAGSKEVL
jgi:hypothetical protein